MKKVIIVAIVGICMVIALLITVMAIGIGNGGFSVGLFTAELANRQAIDASQVRRLSVLYGSEDITVIKTDGSEIVLEEYMSRWDEDMLAEISLSGESLDIRRGRRDFIFGTWIAYIKLYIPESWDGALELENSSGGVKTDDSWTLKSLSVSCSSGDIRLADVRADGDVRLTASSGTVKSGEIVSVGKVELKTSSGDIRSADIRTGGDVKLTASSGSIKSGEIVSAGNVELKTNSGDIRLRSVTAAELSAGATSGSIHIELAAAERITAENNSGGIGIDELAGNYTLQNTSGGISVGGGTGGGRAECNSGDIRISLDRVDSDVYCKTTSGSIKMQIPHDLSFEFQASTTSGSINTFFDGTLSYNKKGNECSGLIGNTPKLRVECRANSGSISFK